jgi:hypothetical protein
MKSLTCRHPPLSHTFQRMPSLATAAAPLALWPNIHMHNGISTIGANPTDNRHALHISEQLPLSDAGHFNICCHATEMVRPFATTNSSVQCRGTAPGRHMNRTPIMRPDLRQSDTQFRIETGRSRLNRSLDSQKPEADTHHNNKTHNNLPTRLTAHGRYDLCNTRAPPRNATPKVELSEADLPSQGLEMVNAAIYANRAKVFTVTLGLQQRNLGVLVAVYLTDAACPHVGKHG